MSNNNRLIDLVRKKCMRKSFLFLACCCVISLLMFIVFIQGAYADTFYTSDDRATCLATPSLRCYTGTWEQYSQTPDASSSTGFSCFPFYTETTNAGSPICGRCMATSLQGRTCNNPQKFTTPDTNQAGCEFNSPS